MSEKMRYGCSLKGMRATLAETLVELGHQDPKMIVVDCETGTATNILDFRDTFPDRYVTTGVAEQSGVSFAFGAARSGLHPVVPLFSSFLTRRACDQIFIQIGYAHANVKMIGCYSGLTTPNTGATHQSINDIALMRSLPGVVVIETADSTELKQALTAMMQIDGPVYVRMIRGDIGGYDNPCVPEDHVFHIGKSSVLREGDDISLIGTGMMVSRCLEAADKLKEKGVSAEVVNCSAIKPFDCDTIVASVRKTGCAVTAENHSIIGGTGSAVAECLAEHCPAPLKRVGIMDQYGESGPLEELFPKYGLTTDKVVEAALALLKDKVRI
jgi:transketolase